MSVVLGSAFTRPLPPPPDPNDDLLLKVLAAVEALRSTVVTLPTPQVTVTPQDLSDIVTAVQDLHGPAGATAEQIATAVREALLGMPQPAPADMSVLGEVAKALEKLDFRMRGTGGVGGTVATISNDVAVKPAAGTTAFPVTVASGTITANTPVANLVTRMNARQPQDGYTLWLDVTSTSSTHIYIAEAVTGTASSASGFAGIRITLDASGNPLGGVATNTNFIWDNRAAATWAT